MGCNIKKIILIILFPCLIFAQTNPVKITGQHTYTFGEDEYLWNAQQKCQDLALRNALECCPLFAQNKAELEDEDLINDIKGIIISSYIYDLETSYESMNENTVVGRAEGYVIPAEIQSLFARFSKTEGEDEEEKTEIEEEHSSQFQRTNIIPPLNYYKRGSAQVMEVRKLSDSKGEVIYKVISLEGDISFRVDFYDKFDNLVEFTTIFVNRFDKKEGEIYKETFSIPKEAQRFEVKMY